jgi:hypothetical protein
MDIMFFRGIEGERRRGRIRNWDFKGRKWDSEFVNRAKKETM